MEIWDVASALGVGEPEPPTEDEVVERRGPVPAMMSALNAAGQEIATVPGVQPRPQRSSTVRSTSPTVADRMLAAGYQHGDPRLVAPRDDILG